MVLTNGITTYFHMKKSKRKSSFTCKHCKGELMYIGSGDTNDGRNYCLIKTVNGYGYRCPTFAPLAQAHELYSKEENIQLLLSKIN